MNLPTPRPPLDVAAARVAWPLCWPVPVAAESVSRVRRESESARCPFFFYFTGVMKISLLGYLTCLPRACVFDASLETLKPISERASFAFSVRV